MLIGAAALTGAIAAVVSAVAPGRSLGDKAKGAASGATVPAAKRSSRAEMPPLASPGALGLQSPAEAPQSAPAPQAAPEPAQSAPAQSAPAESAPAQPSGPVSGRS